jgi:hypothetical protein
MVSAYGALERHDRARHSRRQEAAMHEAKRFHSVLLVPFVMLVLGSTGCGKSPSEPPEDTAITYDVFADLKNTAGAPSIVEAQLLLDGIVIDDEVPTSPTADASFIVGGDPTIAPGNHTLTFLLVKQTDSTATSYTVPKFDFSIFACLDGVLSDDGNAAGRAIHLSAQSGALVPGQSFTFHFSTPDCTIDDDSTKRSHRGGARVSAPLSAPTGSSSLSRLRRPGA